MGNRLHTEDFLHRCSFTVVSTATSPRPSPATTATTPRPQSTPPVPSTGAAGSVTEMMTVSGPPVPTTPRRRTRAAAPLPDSASAPDRYSTARHDGSNQESVDMLVRTASPGSQDRKGTRPAVRSTALPDIDRRQLAATGIDLFIVLLPIVVFSRLFTVVADKDVFSLGAQNLLVWAVVTVIAWAVCTVAWSGRGERTPGRKIVSAVGSRSMPRQQGSRRR